MDFVSGFLFAILYFAVTLLKNGCGERALGDGESVTSLFCLRIHQVRVGFNGIIKTSKSLSTEEAFSMMAFKELERRETLFSDHPCSSSR